MTAAPITQINSRSGQDQGNQPAGEQAITIYQRLLAVAKDLPTIAKTGQNKEQNYPYIEASAIAATMQDLFAKHGVFLKSELSEAEFSDFTTQRGSKGEKVKVLFDFTFINCFDKDDQVSYKSWPGVAMDYSDKALNKAMTAAQKTFLMKQFLISDVDPDADSPQAEAITTPSQQQQTKPQAANRPAATQPSQPNQQSRPATTQPQSPPPAKAAQPAPAPAPALKQPAPAQDEKPKMPDLTQEEYGNWLKELKISSADLVKILTEGKYSALKDWRDVYKAANPNAQIKNWLRFALFNYVQWLMKNKPQSGWLWDEEKHVPRSLEDVPFEEDLPDDLPEE